MNSPHKNKPLVYELSTRKQVVWMTRHMALEQLYRLRVIAARMSVGQRRVPLWKAHMVVMERGLEKVEMECGIPRG